MKEIETLDVIKAGGLNYEDLLGRAVDRCLHYRAVDPDYKFHFSVHALVSAMVDIPGKPLRTEVKQYAEAMYISGEGKPDSSTDRYMLIFEKATDVLAKHGMLFKSTTVDVGGL